MSDTSRFFQDGSQAGWSSLPVHDAPLYPLFLRIHAVTGLEIAKFAGLLNFFLYPLVTVTLFLFLYSLAGSLVPSTIASISTVFSWSFISTYTYAQTEVLFMPFLALAIFCLLHGESRDSMRLVFIAGIASSLCIYTRYAGIFIWLAAGLYFVCVNHRSFSRTVRYSIVFFSSAALPFMALASWNAIRAGSATSRVFTPHPPTSEKLLGGLHWILNYFLPYRLFDKWLIPSVIAFLIILLGALYSLKKYGNINERKYGIICVVWSAAYLMFLYVSLTYFDDHTQLAGKILAPLTITLVCCVMYSVSMAAIRGHNRIIQGFFVGIVCYMCIFTGHRAFGFISKAYTDGVGLGSIEIRESKSLKDSVKLSNTYRIYSNAPEVAHLIYHIDNFRSIPYTISPKSLLPNPDFDHQFESLKNEVLSNQAIIVIFYFKHKPDVWTHYLPSLDEIREKVSGVTIREYDDGLIIGAISASNTVSGVLSKY